VKSIAVQCALTYSAEDVEKKLKEQKIVLTSKMESLYFHHKKEMNMYRFAENERSLKNLKALKDNDDLEVDNQETKFEPIEAHIFEELDAFDLKNEVKQIMIGKIDQIKKGFRVELQRSIDESNRLKA